MSEKYLPLGSVVRLDGGEKRVMVYGRRQKHLQSGRVFDYVACLFPEGNLDEEHTYLFDHSDIAEVAFVGLLDEEEAAYLVSLIKDEGMWADGNTVVAGPVA